MIDKLLLHVVLSFFLNGLCMKIAEAWSSRRYARQFEVERRV